jgi:hypothetical protein
MTKDRKVKASKHKSKKDKKSKKRAKLDSDDEPMHESRSE